MHTIFNKEDLFCERFEKVFIEVEGSYVQQIFNFDQ